MTQIQAIQNMSQPEVVDLYLELLQRYEDDIATLSRELASRTTSTHKVGLGFAGLALGSALATFRSAARLAEEAAHKDRLSGAAPTTAQLWAMSCGYPLRPETFTQIARDVLEKYGKLNDRDGQKDSLRLNYLEKNYGRTISLRNGDWCSNPERKPYQAAIETIAHPNLRSAIDYCLADANLNPGPAFTAQDICRLFRVPPDFFKCSCPSGNGSLRPWPCPVHPPETPKATEENDKFLHTRYSIEGTVIFKREKESSEKRCICCPDSTSHIYNRHIRWDGGGRSDDIPLLEQITKRTDSEGKRVKLTLDVIAEPDGPHN